MAIWDANQIGSISSTQLIVPAGATNALFFQAAQGQVGVWFKWFSGGTVEILSCGYTQPINAVNSPLIPIPMGASGLNSLAGKGFQLDTTGSTGPTTTPIIYGSAYCMLSTQGATAIVHTLIMKGAGY